MIDGFTILVGKNNKQNDMLTCKIAKPNDLWFHTQDIHGSHVVLRLEKSIDKYDKSKIDSIIYRCATIAAYFSKARMSSNVPVDYTHIKYVKKPNGAKPGMVIFTNNRTLFVNPKEP
jgi:predicted ribosome quality control (RQC) complex YloA/Tae2 family protein